jgi:aldehyde:ferredoxin oxidoreductase
LLISERYKERRYQEGVAKGLAEGAAKMARKWQDWNNRRLAAESRGEQFDEPTPAVPSTQD